MGTLGLSFILIGCAGNVVAKPDHDSTSDPVWQAVDAPLKDFHFTCTPNKVDCFFRGKGVWRSTSGPESELAWPTISSISCDKPRRVCSETYATVDDMGRLDVDATDFEVSLWTNDKIIASTVVGLCDVGNQIIVDLSAKTVSRQTYPTQPLTNDLCKAFTRTNTYLLHGGGWTLQPAARKKY